MEIQNMDVIKKNEFENVTFKDLQLSEADLASKTFDDCVFMDCEFIDCSFRSVIINNCEFRNCNLSNLALTNSKMGEVLFTECKLVGLNFSSCKKLLFSIKLDRCISHMCNFSGLKMIELSFRSSEFQDCDFYEAILTGTDFSYCNLKGSLFENCDLSEADFRIATNYAIDPTQNKLKRARFSMPEVLSFLAPLELEIE